MNEYLSLLEGILDSGEPREDRTGTGTLSVFGPQLSFDLQQGFPAVTTKKLFFESVKVELAWFLRGDTSVDYLHKHDVHIWDEWADDDGELGPIYGEQWRYWDAGMKGASKGKHVWVDQIGTIINTLQRKPESRRHLVSAWNVGELGEMNLNPCHVLFQFYVRELDSDDPKLDCKLYQRSADMFLGVPFNIASYSLLTHLVADEVGLSPGRFIHTFGDAHIYKNHIDQVEEQLSRDPFGLPDLELSEEYDGVDSFEPEHARLANYRYHPPIHAPVSV